MRVILVAVGYFLLLGCSTSGSLQDMRHPDYRGELLEEQRKVAIADCEKENTVTFSAFENVSSGDTHRGLAQMGRRANEQAAFDTLVEQCMERHGWQH